MESIDLSKTLDELEGVESGDPTFHSSLVVECTILRKVPLKDFTPANLRNCLKSDFRKLYSSGLTRIRSEKSLLKSAKATFQTLSKDYDWAENQP